MLPDLAQGPGGYPGGAHGALGTRRLARDKEDGSAVLKSFERLADTTVGKGT